MNLDQEQKKQWAQKVYDLCLLYRKGDREAGNTLIRMNRGLVVLFVRKKIGNSQKRSAHAGDFLQEGFLGLLRAAEDFDPDQAKWVTYASIWIRSKIGAYWEDHRDTVRTPRGARLRCRKGKSDAYPSLTTSLEDAILGEEGNGANRWEEVLCDEDAEQADEALCGVDLEQASRDIVSWIKDRIPRRTWEIIAFHHLGPRKMKLTETGERFNLSGERIRQIEADFFNQVQRLCLGVTKNRIKWASSSESIAIVRDALGRREEEREALS